MKEAGYAGFIIPIDVHLKNHQIIHVQYDLILDTQMATKRSLIERHTVVCTADDFRKKLIRGGGVCILSNIFVVFVYFYFLKFVRSTLFDFCKSVIRKKFNDLRCCLHEGEIFLHF